MNDLPLISVALCTYNGERFLVPALESILQQTYPNLELVIVDDGSTDGTAELLNRYAQQHSNIRLYYNEENLGLIKNFEKALSLTLGEYISFADQDDVWLAQKTEVLYQSIGNHTLAYCDSAYTDAEGKLMGKKISDYRYLSSGSNLFIADEQSGIWVAGHAMLFKRELLELALPFNPFISHDTWIAYVAMVQGNIIHVAQPLVHYRQHANNLVGGLGCHTINTKTKKKESQSEKIARQAGRIEALLALAPASATEFCDFLHKMHTYTSHPTFMNRIKRMALRCKYSSKIYAPRKRGVVRRYFKIVKAF